MREGRVGRRASFARTALLHTIALRVVPRRRGEERVDESLEPGQRFGEFLADVVALMRVARQVKERRLRALALDLQEVDVFEALRPNDAVAPLRHPRGDALVRDPSSRIVARQRGPVVDAIEEPCPWQIPAGRIPRGLQRRPRAPLLGIGHLSR